MSLRWSVRPNIYVDSVKLMRVSEALSTEPGVVRAAVVMGTALNLELLGDDGLLPDGVTVTADDLLISILGTDDDAAERALARMDELLAPRWIGNGAVDAGAAPRTIERGAMDTGANIAVIAVPGQSAAAEAFAALRAGLHVFLFSDNVGIDEEVRLKALAAQQDLLMMGPDCGTAIISGVGLGFANRVQRGPVGIVGASGTGIQQICCLLDAAGIGIAHAIGTGGRDLSKAVGGSMTRRALRLLDADASVESIALVSKPADAGIAAIIHEDLCALSKPAVACLLGAKTSPHRSSRTGVRYVATLADAAATITRLCGHDVDGWWKPRPPRRRSPGGLVRGLFAGGTLSAEAAQVLDAVGAPHRLLDLGADEYTIGRAHPMIDPRLRESMLQDLESEEDVGAVLLDVVLGDLAHPDPAATLIPGIRTLSSRIPVFVSLVGSRRDPQGLDRQREALEGAGALVFSANADAARAAGIVTRQRAGPA